MQLRVCDHGNLDGFRAGNLLPLVIPGLSGGVFARREHVLADAGAGSGVFQAFHEFGIAAVVRPRRYKGGKGVEPGGVGVGVGADVNARGAGLLNAGHNLRHAAPVRLARGLEVPDFDRNVSFASDARRLIDGFEDRIALAAYVGGVDAAELCGLAG